MLCKSKEKVSMLFPRSGMAFAGSKNTEQ